MRFWERIFGNKDAAVKKPSQTPTSATLDAKGTFVCQNNKCRELYRLDHIVTVSDDDLMDWIKGGDAIVIGEMSGHPILVGHSERTTSENRIKAFIAEASKVGWQCNKCKAKNSWKGMRQ